MLSHGQCEQCGQPGAVVSILLFYKGLLLIFARLKGHSSLSNPSVDVPLAHLEKDEFAVCGPHCLT